MTTRKLDTIRKINIGGLVIRAQLDYLFDLDLSEEHFFQDFVKKKESNFKPTKMYGALLYLQSLIKKDPTLLIEFEQLGKIYYEKD